MAHVGSWRPQCDNCDKFTYEMSCPDDGGTTRFVYIPPQQDIESFVYESPVRYRPGCAHTGNRITHTQQVCDEREVTICTDCGVEV